MKVNVFTILSIASLIIISTLFIYTIWPSKAPNNTVYSINQVHTYLDTDGHKKIIIPLFIESNNILFDVEMITKIAIRDVSSDQWFALHLNTIEPVYQFNHHGTLLRHVNLHVELAFKTEQQALFIADAVLIVNLKNDTTYELPIGEFNYWFIDISNRNDLSVKHIHNVHQNIGFGETSTGLLITLENQLASTLCLLDISLNSTKVKPNFGYLMVYEDAFDPFIDASLIMGIDYNHLENKPKTIKEHCMINYQTKSVFIPYDYLSEIVLTHYPILITYRVNREIKQFIIEDFTFIRTDWPLENYKGVIHQNEPITMD